MMSKRRRLIYYELGGSTNGKEISMQRDLVIYSGGLDSTVLLAKVHAANKEVRAVHFSYGQKHSVSELQAALKVCIKLGVFMQIIELPFECWGFKSALLEQGEAIPIGDYDEENLKKTVVPFRNGVMISIAAGIAASQGGGTVHIGAHAGDHAIYPDCRPLFLDHMDGALQSGTIHRVNLEIPFIHLSKSSIVKFGAKISAPMELSYSCYKGGELHCGECATCRERKKAFEEANIPDQTEYVK